MEVTGGGKPCSASRETSWTVCRGEDSVAVRPSTPLVSARPVAVPSAGAAPAPAAFPAPAATAPDVALTAAAPVPASTALFRKPRRPTNVASRDAGLLRFDIPPPHLRPGETGRSKGVERRAPQLIPLCPVPARLFLGDRPWVTAERTRNAARLPNRSTADPIGAAEGWRQDWPHSARPNSIGPV